MNAKAKEILQKHILQSNYEWMKHYKSQLFRDTLNAMNEYAKISNETIDFAVYLTGHDKETIEQMYNDWKR